MQKEKRRKHFKKNMIPKEKELSRLEREKDKNSNSVVAVYDLQAVLPCPKGDASSFYYVSNLIFLISLYSIYKLMAFSITYGMKG
jgi:hypothetical protein